MGLVLVKTLEYDKVGVVVTLLWRRAPRVDDVVKVAVIGRGGSTGKLRSSSLFFQSSSCPRTARAKIRGVIAW